jgi:hypothetical protein
MQCVVVDIYPIMERSFWRIGEFLPDYGVLYQKTIIFTVTIARSRMLQDGRVRVRWRVVTMVTNVLEELWQAYSILWYHNLES